MNTIMKSLARHRVTCASLLSAGVLPATVGGCSDSQVSSLLNSVAPLGVVYLDGRLAGGGGDESWWDRHDQDLEWLVWPFGELFD